MATSLASRIQDVLPRTKDAYYKLILAVGPTRAGKTAALFGLAKQKNWARLNVNLRLSEKLLNLTRRQRAVRVASILDDTIREEGSEIVLLDNLELLFSEELAQDPLRLLQSLSRNQTIVAAWPGNFDGTSLTYAEPGHPDARRYTAPQAVIVRAGDCEEINLGSSEEDGK